MQPEPQDKYIELKINRDFGSVINDYFEFIKRNIKTFTNVFLGYNGIFLIGLLISSYLLVSGFVGLFAYGQNSYLSDVPSDDTYQTYLIIGGLLFALILFVVAILNYSISTSYMVLYDQKGSTNFGSKEVWARVKKKIGDIALFVFLIVIIYIGVAIVQLIFGIIPLLGTLAGYVVQFFIGAWVGVSFFVVLAEDKGVVEALGEGWNLVTKSFWKCVGVNFILGLLIALLLFVIMMPVAVIIGFYSYHVVDTDIDVSATVVPTVIWTIGLTVLLVFGVFAQCLSQFVNGFLYYGLHEKTYNTFTRSKIEQIGGFDT